MKFSHDPTSAASQRWATLRHPTGGFTLIEIIVVLGIIALIVGTGMSTIMGYSNSQRVRDEATRLIRVIRYVYYQAASEGLYYRIGFDLNDNTYTVEYSPQPFYVVREGDEKEAIRLRNEEDLKKFQSSFDAAAEAEAAEESGTAPPPADAFGQTEDEWLEDHQLKYGARFRSAYVMHQAEALGEGKAYLYFFPRGQTEFAVLTLAAADEEEDEAEAELLSLIVNPLNGTVELREGQADHEEILAEYNQQS